MYFPYIKIGAMGVGVWLASQTMAVETYIFAQNETQNRSGIWQQELGNNTRISQLERMYGVGFNGEAQGFVYHLRAQTTEDDANAEDTVKIKESTLQMRSLYRDFDISDSISIKIGKFTENWQIANVLSPFSFASPDSRTIQLSNPLSIDNSTLGVAVRYYAPSGDTTYTLYVNADQREEDAVTHKGYQFVALRASTFISENTDVTLVAQKYKNSRLGVGAGFRNIATDALALYGSAFIRKGTVRAIHKGVWENNPNLVDPTNAVSDHRINDNKIYINAMIGLQYTTENNFQYWLEYGYDQRGMDNGQWKTFKDLVNTHKGLSGAQAPLRTPNLSTDSSLLHERGLRQQYVWVNMNKEFGVYDVSASVRVGVDTSAAWSFGVDYEGFDAVTMGTQLNINTGSPDTEFASYQVSDNRFTIFFRRDF